MCFENKHQHAVEHGAGGKLYQGEAHTVQIGNNLVHGDDLRCKAKGTDEGVKIPLVDGKAFVDADKIHAYRGDSYADALNQGNAGAIDGVAQKGHQHNI